LCLRVLGNTEGNDRGEGQGLLTVGRGAALSNTQGKGDESIDSLLGYSENTEEGRTGVGPKRQKT